MARQMVLFVVSDWGSRGEELIGPLSACEKVGYEVAFVRPTRTKARRQTAGLRPSYIGLPLGNSATGEPAVARGGEDRKRIMRGKHATGHLFEYDYKDGTGFVGDHPGLGRGLNMGPPFYPLEFILRDAVGPEGQFHGNVGKETSVIVDYPFITARSTGSSYACGERLVGVLEKGLRKYGVVSR